MLSSLNRLRRESSGERNERQRLEQEKEVAGEERVRKAEGRGKKRGVETNHFHRMTAPGSKRHG